MCVESEMSKEDTPLPVTSSHEPEWDSEAKVFYREALQTLQQGGVPFVVGGGFAFHKHTGIWRVTKDLDLVLTPGEIPRALCKLEQAGFATDIEDPVWLAKARRGDYFVDLITGVGNATLAVEESWIERSVVDDVLGIRCRILPAEELIASKLFVTRRERFDGADIAHLIRQVGRRLDWDRLMLLSGQYWIMLYWALVLFAFIYPMRIELVPDRIWEDLTRRFNQSLKSSIEQVPFRGSLVDPKMFAIDVNEWGERDLLRELTESYPHLLKKPAGSVE